MTLLLQICLANVAVASLLALVAFGVGKVCRRPALVHSLWLLVLLKLVTPPLFWLPVAWPATPEPQAMPQAAAVPPPTEVVVVNEPVVGENVAWWVPADQRLRPNLERVLAPAEARLVTVPVVLRLPPSGPPPDPPPPAFSWTTWFAGWAEATRPWLPAVLWAWLAGTVIWFLW